MGSADEETLRVQAEADDPKAMIDLWLALRHGPRAEEGAAWVRRAVEAGSTDAMRMLGAWQGRHDPAEQERLYLRAAEAGDRTAFSLLALGYYEQERWAEAEHWLRRATESGFDWSLSPKLALLLARRGADDEAWEVCLQADDPGHELYELAMTLSEEGSREAADRWMRDAFDLGSGAAAAYFGGVRERDGDLAGAERLYREARFIRPLVEFLERQGRVAEARSTLEGEGDSERFAAFLERHGEPGEAAEMRDRIRRRRFEGPEEQEWVTTVATVVTTCALVPFVEALIGRLADGAYDGVRGKLRKLARKLARNGEPAESTLIVVNDPGSHLRLHMRTDATDEALAALRDVDLSGPPGALRWNPETRKWEHR
ncbi:tetratricopeptide repeat protein [Streptosporangium sp. LJ11]|uniref:tetratricopeptide repeat protein n=1 Tax=Streptosporangium sp. LJ11 TaxID=3436927 RepID=UPI003F792F15